MKVTISQLIAALQKVEASYDGDPEDGPTVEVVIIDDNSVTLTAGVNLGYNLECHLEQYT